MRVIVRDILYKKEGEGKNDIPHICLEMFVLFSLLFYARSRRLGLEIKKRRPGWVGKISPTRRQQQLMTDDNIFFFTHLYSSIFYIAPSKISYCSGGFHLVARSSVRLLLHDGSDDDETQYKCARQSSQKNLHFLFQKLYCNAPELNCTLMKR